MNKYPVTHYMQDELCSKDIIKDNKNNRMNN